MADMAGVDDEPEGIVTQANVKAKIESWLIGLRRILGRIAEIEVAKDKAKRLIDEEHAAELTELEEARDMLKQQIVNAFLSHRKFLLPGKSQTAKFANGLLKQRAATEALVIVDDDEAERWLRRMGMWRRFKTTPKPKPNKTKLKEAKDVIARAPDRIMHLLRTVRLSIEVPAVTIKDRTDPYPLRTEVELPEE